MEEEKKLLLALEFDTDAGLKRAADLRAAIDADRESLAALNKEIKAQGPVTKEQLLQREQLEKRIRENTRARGEEIKKVDDYTKATKTQQGLINSLRGQLTFLTTQWNNLTEAEIENAEIGGKLQKEIKGISDKLKTLEGSVGDTRRNVGNYTAGVREAIEQSGFLSGVTMQVKDAQEKLIATLNIMKAGLGGNISMLKLFRFALAATGIGAVLLLLGGLVSYLTKTQEGIDWVNRKMAGLNTVIAVLTDKLSAVGKEAFEAFSSPKTALEALVKFIENQFLNRVKAIGVLFEALKNRDFNKLQDGIAQLAFGITDATAKSKALREELEAVARTAEAIEKENQRIRDAERALNVERAKSKAQIEALKFVAEDVTRSEGERVAAAQKAFQIEQDIINRQLELQRERIENIKAQQRLTNNLTADNDKLAEETTKLAEMEEGSLTRQIELRNKINEIRTAAAAKREAEFKAHQEEVKKELELFQKVVDGLAESRKKQLEEEKKFRDEYKKTIDQQFQNSEKVRQAALEQEKLEAEEKIRLSNLVIEQKEKELQGIYGLAEASHNLFALLAEENSSFAEFEKAVTLFKIGLASADALTKGIAASQDIPFPGNLIAMGTTIATITANLLQAKKLIQGNAPKAPASKFAEGGILEGPSHSAGGIRGTGSFAGIEVEGQEAIINKRSTAMFLPILNAINMAGGGKPLAPSTYMAAGGLIPRAGQMPGSMNTPVIDYGKLAREMAKVQIVVKPTEVISHYQHRQARISEASLGA